MLTLTRALALCFCLSSPALAECVTPASLANGVTFTREDGRSGWAQADGDVLTISYDSDPGNDQSDYRKARLGIYESLRSSSFSDKAVIGHGQDAGYIRFLAMYRIVGEPPAPEAGMAWANKVFVMQSTDNGSETGAQSQSYMLKVNYTAQAEETAKLSGCTYRILPVEAHFTNKDTDLTRRFIYFPDLGFGLETRVIDHKGDAGRELGLTSLTPKG